MKDNPIFSKHKWGRVFATVFSLLLLTMTGTGCTPDDQPEPYFSVIPNFQQVHGHHWPVGETLTLTIDDPMTKETPDFTATETVIEAPWDPGTASWVEFKLYEHHHDPAQLVKPGNILTLSGKRHSKTHIIQPLFVSRVDPELQQISGTAEPGSQVRVDPHPNLPDTYVVVTTDADGIWQASSPDWALGPSFGGDATQADEDADTTQIQLRLPTINASPEHAFIELSDFSYNTEITLSIEPQGLSKTVTTDPQGYAWIEPWQWVQLEGFKLQPGNVVSVIDHFSGLSKILELESLNVQAVDIELDQIYGIGPPGRMLVVDANGQNASVSLEVKTNADGSWLADFSGILELEPEMLFSARLPDADFDTTAAPFEIGQ